MLAFHRSGQVFWRGTAARRTTTTMTTEERLWGPELPLQQDEEAEAEAQGRVAGAEDWCHRNPRYT